ncbi:MAG: signal recognition particle-docking protein FtsY [Nisaea sp.]|nr:signal recognition particle-docking protein FtsY [Nisaea sp.]OUX97438.1 MAG: signal recognition particle-docking protein FtsY [Candidatus Endolissoclinum sp. TMED26]
MNAQDDQQTGWFGRLKSGLSKSSSKLTGGIAAIFKSRKLDTAALEELEDLLITADLGVATAALLTANLARDRFDKDVGDDEVRTALAANIAELLSPVARPLVIDRGHQPHVVMFVGVNGSGKTTTIGKMAQHYRAQGLTVMLAAADTFRAAAIEQLQIWGQRVGVPVVARAHGADSAAVAYEALARAQAENIDLLLIDTAGRLQNKTELMDELAKVVRVLGKQNPEAPHDRILVLDGTVGQNAHSQVQAFSELTDITGLVVTKLDGSARGGVVVSLTERFGLPIHAIGVGEAVADLDAFVADDFARNLMGLDQA